MVTLRRQSPTGSEDAGLEMSSRLQGALVSMLRGSKPVPTRAALSVKPWVILFLGVNGVGKTTTIGKLAAQYRNAGKKVLLVAGDTFRAAAIEQLDVWGQRAGVDVIKHRPGADPSAVVFDGMQAAKSRGTDVLLIDTAGRLHTKLHLIEELKKIRRVIAREQPDAPHETFLVLDATTGQNGLQQARVFKEATDINGIVLTKLDGTAKGGVIISIQEELAVPVKYIGVGEDVEDLQPFDPERFVQALFET
jgi:fused signal recognition particle receptor